MMGQRKNFRDRLNRTVGTLLRNRNEAPKHIEELHGIERNNNICIEIRCSNDRYPYRDEYVRNVLPQKEISRHIRQNGGVYLSLVDYLGTATSSNVVHIRWSEVPFIQVWTIYSRGDHRPPIGLKNDIGPMHHRSIHSILFGVRSHQPARATERYILTKKLKVVHFFLSMLRERDNRHMIHLPISVDIN